MQNSVLSMEILSSGAAFVLVAQESKTALGQTESKARLTFLNDCNLAVSLSLPRPVEHG